MTNLASSFDDIPDPIRPTDQPPIRTDLDLHRFWRMVMGPLGFSRRSLWISFTDGDGRVSPALQQIDDVPRRAGHADGAALMELLAHLRDGYAGGAVAICYSRPGRGPMSTDDRSWAHVLNQAAARFDVPLWPMHFANDSALLVFAPDDLVEPG